VKATFPKAARWRGESRGTWPAPQAWLLHNQRKPTLVLAALRKTGKAKSYPRQARNGQTKVSHERDHTLDLWLQGRCVHLPSTLERSGSYRSLFWLSGFREVALQVSWVISLATVTSVLAWSRCLPLGLCKIPGAFTEVVSSRDVLLYAHMLPYACPCNTSSMTVVVLINSLCTQDETHTSFRGVTGGCPLHHEHQGSCPVCRSGLGSSSSPSRRSQYYQDKITHSPWSCGEATAIMASFGQAVLPNSIPGLAHGCFWKHSPKCGLSSAISGGGVAWQSLPTWLRR